MDRANKEGLSAMSYPVSWHRLEALYTILKSAGRITLSPDSGLLLRDFMCYTAKEKGEILALEWSGDHWTVIGLIDYDEERRRTHEDSKRG